MEQHPGNPRGEAPEETSVLQTIESGDFALLPPDDEAMELLVERSPRLWDACGGIRERTRRGAYRTQEEVLAALGEDEAREGWGLPADAGASRSRVRSSPGGVAAFDADTQSLSARVHEASRFPGQRPLCPTA
ncbi:MAG: hypothetical protein HY321_16375 [Armatimonadetes bacterium]|nr:hypothetical protein [Armatimonadota bacterium]